MKLNVSVFRLSLSLAHGGGSAHNIKRDGNLRNVKDGCSLNFNRISLNGPYRMGGRALGKELNSLEGVI